MDILPLYPNFYTYYRDILRYKLSIFSLIIDMSAPVCDACSSVCQINLSQLHTL